MATRIVSRTWSQDIPYPTYLHSIRIQIRQLLRIYFTFRHFLLPKNWRRGGLYCRLDFWHKQNLCIYNIHTGHWIQDTGYRAEKKREKQETGHGTGPGLAPDPARSWPGSTKFLICLDATKSLCNSASSCRSWEYRTKVAAKDSPRSSSLLS